MWEYAAKDAVPGRCAGDQTLDGIPVATVAKGEAAANGSGEFTVVRPDLRRVGRRAFDGHDTLGSAQPTDKTRREPKMCGPWVVVYAQGQSTLACDSGKMLEHFVVGGWRIGDRGARPAVAPAARASGANRTASSVRKAPMPAMIGTGPDIDPGNFIRTASLCT